VVITPYVRSTIWSNTGFSDRGTPGRQNAYMPNMMPSPISVKAIGKPSRIAATMSPSITMPMWALVICDGGGRKST
jgi:hypothetical protein